MTPVFATQILQMLFISPWSRRYAQRSVLDTLLQAVSEGSLPHVSSIPAAQRIGSLSSSDPVESEARLISRGVRMS